MTEPTLQYDPDVKLPKSVLDAAARAEAFYATAPEQPAEGEAAVTSAGNPDLDASALANDNQPTEQPTTQPVSEAPKSEDETWEHKYKSINGRYIRSQETVRQQAEMIQNLQSVIATLQATAQVAPAQTDLPELKAERLITDEEAADYGEDFLKVVGKKAREELAPVIKGYQDKIAQLEKRLEGFTGFVQQDSHAKLMANLDERLPNWREVNTNEEFLNWLSLPDPYSGAIRHDMLKAAYAQGNASRVLAFFNGFLAEEAAVAPAQAEPDPEVTKVAKVPLANLAAPGRAKTAAPAPAPAEKPIFTRAQIAAFYADVAQGKYRGRDADKNKAEAAIFAAQREGRIR